MEQAFHLVFAAAHLGGREERPPDHLVGRVAVHQFGGPVPAGDVPVQRFPDDRITIIILSNQMDVTVGIISREFATLMLNTLTK